MSSGSDMLPDFATKVIQRPKDTGRFEFEAKEEKLGTQDRLNRSLSGAIMTEFESPGLSGKL